MRAMTLEYGDIFMTGIVAFVAVGVLGVGFEGLMVRRLRKRHLATWKALGLSDWWSSKSLRGYIELRKFCYGAKYRVLDDPLLATLCVGSVVTDGLFVLIFFSLFYFAYHYQGPGPHFF